ncbi:MAG: hypothetical protein DBX52_01845 [Clostridiales bacterium]|nr:MAG: hypothetical protein DBX52_01845 [Clostridiales bacterium]
MKFEEIFQNCCEQMREATLQGLLAEDAAYLEDVKDEFVLKTQYEQLTLSPDQKMIIEDYFACRESKENQRAVLSYIAGIKDVIKILKYLNLLQMETNSNSK